MTAVEGLVRPNVAFQRAIALVLVCVTACYMQQPLATPVPAPATRIVAAMTDSGTVVMSNTIGPGVVQVEGVVASANTEFWNLHLVRIEHRDGRSIGWNRELVSFPRSVLLNPAEKRIDRKRTWLVAGLIVLGSVVAAGAFRLLTSDETTGGNPVPIQ